MHWVTVIWSMIAAATLTLAVVHAFVWWRGRDARAHALFSLSAAGTAVFAICELRVMTALTPAECGEAIRWAHVPLWVLFCSLVGFVGLYLRAGRPWLGWTVVALRTVSLGLNFAAETNLNFGRITEVVRVPFFGEPVSVAVGPTNPWMAVGQASNLLLLAFVADAAVTALRRGDTRKALMVGGSIALFVLGGWAQSLVAILGAVQMPITISLFYLGIVLAMGYEVSRDVLRAAQLSHDLRESGERLKLAAEAADVGLWTRDVAQNEFWATARFRAMFGFAAAEPLDLDRLLDRSHPDDRDVVARALAEAMAAGGGFELEHRVVLPDGQVRWIASRGRVDPDGDGRHPLVRGVALDITERRRTEAEAHELREGMAHGARVTMLGQLASSLAHELSQPLGAILRNSEAAELLLRCDPPDLDELRAIVADIHRDDRRAGDVIDRLRSLLKRHSLESGPIDINVLVEEVGALVRSDCAARGVKLATTVPHDLPLVRGDRVHLLQVLLNLIINGMDAVEAEPAADRRVAVRARWDGDGTVEVAVSDSGHGVPAGKLEDVFEPFVTTKPNGMGMGLPISRTIIEAHGGRIWAEPNAGRGTTFRFTLSADHEAGGAA